MRVTSESVKAAVVFAVLGVVVGCHSAPAPAKNTLHVISARWDGEGSMDVIGTLNGQTYALSPDRDTDHVPLYVAAYDPIDLQDVGKDFPARFDKNSGEVIVHVPVRGQVHYSVRSVTEKNHSPELR